MTVEDQLDRGIGRVRGIKELEKLDELATAIAILDQGMNLAGEQINSGQQTKRTVALVLIVARQTGMLAGCGAVVAIAWIPGFSS